MSSKMRRRKFKVRHSSTKPATRNPRYYDGNRRVMEPIVESREALCPKCLHVKDPKNPDWCKAFKHEIKGKITSCKTFKDRFLHYYLRGTV